MRGVEIQPFSDEHVEAAAGLLEARHARHVEAEPLLPANIDFRAEVKALWKTDSASGVAATRNGEVVGYLLGVHRDETWGPNVWVELAGHAVEEPELVRDLYGAAAAGWVEEGRHRHYALVPASDPALVDAWFRLSFGAQHAAAIQETPPEATDVAPPGASARRAVAEDVDEVVTLDLELPRHQELSPVFADSRPWTAEESREEFLKDVDDPEVGLIVGEVEGRVVSLVAMVPVEKSSMHTGLARPERAAFLGYAATLPEARGSGAGLAATNEAFAWARERDYPSVIVDWRETNLLASRFWPARGFRRTFLRLYRSIP
jgi:ribosomal protein S18 acetylase RimI-like enzyme